MLRQATPPPPHTHMHSINYRSKGECWGMLTPTPTPTHPHTCIHACRSLNPPNLADIYTVILVFSNGVILLYSFRQLLFLCSSHSQPAMQLLGGKSGEGWRTSWWCLFQLLHRISLPSVKKVKCTLSLMPFYRYQREPPAHGVYEYVSRCEWNSETT